MTSAPRSIVSTIAQHEARPGGPRWCRAELEAVMAEITLIIRQVDAINRFRFGRDAEALAAWKSARDVAWPAPVEEEEKPAA